MMDFYTASNSWTNYFTDATPGSLVSGKGYAIQRETDGTVTFRGAILTGTAYKAEEEAWPEIIVALHSKDNASATSLLFNDSMTPGLDVGYDAGAFQTNRDLFIYSRLVEDNGVDFAIQCLPANFEEPLTIPPGTEASEFSEVEFFVHAKEWPAETGILLEDRLNHVPIPCNETMESYPTTLSEPGTGRFLLPKW